MNQRLCESSSSLHPSGHTRKAKVQEDKALPVLHTADLLEIEVHHQEEAAGQESQQPYCDAIVAGSFIAVENAVQHRGLICVHITLIDDGAKHHNREHLQWGREGGRKERNNVQLKPQLFPKGFILYHVSGPSAKQLI